MNTPYVVSRYYRAPELIMAVNKYDTSIRDVIHGKLQYRQECFAFKHRFDKALTVPWVWSGQTSPFPAIGVTTSHDKEAFHEISTAGGGVKEDACSGFVFIIILTRGVRFLFFSQ